MREPAPVVVILGRDQDGAGASLAARKSVAGETEQGRGAVGRGSRCCRLRTRYLVRPDLAGQR